MPLTAKAFAKINLFLDITGKRDNGYHELDSVFQSVSLFDEIVLDLKEEGIEILCDNEELLGDNNIVYKACELFFKETFHTGGAFIRIKKNIPVAAGLAGGSADAAATLLLLNKAFNNAVPFNRLCELGEQLGADVPFCLKGGTARVKGIGEMISPMKTPSLHYVLLKEREKQSTGKMFAIIDEIEHNHNDGIDDLIDGLNHSDVNLISKNLFNAFAYCWDFDDMTKPFNEFSYKGVFLSGSGPTVCALFDNANDALNCANKLREKGLNAFYASSVDCGVEIV